MSLEITPKEMSLTAVSLFAGVGGFDLALERNGVKVVASVEIDAKARDIIARHFPNSRLFNDVTEVTGEQLISAGFTPDRGIITGGFPCQDLSVAGKRAGLAGERSGLFWEIVRIAKETQAKYLILENVPGLLSSQNGRDFAIVLTALQDIGYVRIAWRVLDAQHFGVPQRRRRIFIVATLGEGGASPSEILALTEGRAGYLAKGEQKGKVTAREVAEGVGESRLSNGKPIANCLPAELYHHSSVVNQDVDAGHLVVGEWWNGNSIADSLTATSNEQRMPDKGRLQVVITGPLQARDYKGVGNQYVAENKLVY